MASAAPFPTGSVAPRGLRADSLRGGMALSMLVHAALVAGIVLWSRTDSTPMPPAYRVRLMGAPPGPRQAGVVNAADKPATPKPLAAGAERPPDAPKAPPITRQPATLTSPKATPTPSTSRDAGSKAATPQNTRTAAPRAGAGAEGGKGADVANVDLRGIAFPHQGYLDNIVRMITLNWQPRRRGASLLSVVKFVIRRDGSVAEIEVVKRSGDGVYDLDAMGAIEAVGSTRGFGRLPAAWTDDALVVYFTFDYSLRPSP